MKVELKEISVRELTSGYSDTQEGGVQALSGRLDIRPAYQREFIYKDAQRQAVINTVTKGYPLNSMYWAIKRDGNYEVIDGQQRTISVCQYITGAFAHKERYFHNLHDDERKQILDYKINVYLCSGTEAEELEWFRTINIAGEKLTEQELRNAVYSGTWVTEAKKYFSKTNCVAYGLASDYMIGSPIRQTYLETAIDWISNGDIEGYMAEHQNDTDVNELWLYFQSVINWTKATFIVYRKEMKGLPWGTLYNLFGSRKIVAKEIENQISILMMDDNVTNKKGIYTYVLDGREKNLNIRAFSEAIKRKCYEQQGGICPSCGERFEIEQMEADHITPWCEGGSTVVENCQMLCKEDNRRKGAK